MKKLLIVLALCVFAVSCCEVDHNNSQKKEPEKITATSFKVYTQRGSLVCEYYEFMYHGHKYITNYGENFYFILLSVLVSISLWKIKVYELLQYLL